jgi:hypothetical protein
MTDDEIMAKLRKIDQKTEFDDAMQGHVRDLRRSYGCNVTCLEVIATGTVLFLVHAAAEPSMTTIRRAALPHLERALQ